MMNFFCLKGWGNVAFEILNNVIIIFEVLSRKFELY